MWWAQINFQSNQVGYQILFCKIGHSNMLVSIRKEPPAKRIIKFCLLSRICNKITRNKKHKKPTCRWEKMFRYSNLIISRSSDSIGDNVRSEKFRFSLAVVGFYSIAGLFCEDFRKGSFRKWNFRVNWIPWKVILRVRIWFAVGKVCRAWKLMVGALKLHCKIC